MNMEFEMLTRRIAASLKPACARWAAGRGRLRAPAAGAWLHGSVPLHLLALHDARLADAIWAQVRGLLLRPVQTMKMSGGATAVQVLGTAVFIRGASGMLHPFLWETPDSLERVETNLVMVTEVPYGSLWLKRVVSLAQQARNRAFGDATQAMVEEYLSWLTAKLAGRIRSHHDMRKVRHRVAEALGIDRQAWQLCHRLQLTTPLDGKATVHQYNLCVRHRHALLEVQRVAPQAIGVYGALCARRDFPTEGEPLQRLKAYLRSRGTDSRTWLLVVRDGGRLLRMARHFYRGTADGTVLDALHVMHGLSVAKMPPPWLFQAIYAEWGHAGARRSSYAHLMAPAMGNLRHLVRCLLTRQISPSAMEEEEIAEVVHWISEPDTPGLTRAQRQGGWAYVARRSREYHQKLEDRAAANDISWKVPFETLQTGKLRLVAISGALQLMEEGMRMRNCARNFQGKCASGNELLVSVLNDGGKRVATASYVKRSGGWVFSDAKAPMNRSLPANVMSRLRKCAALIPLPVPPVALSMKKQRKVQTASGAEKAVRKE